MILLTIALTLLLGVPSFAAGTKVMKKNGAYFTSTVTDTGSTTYYHRFKVGKPVEMYVMAQNSAGAYVNVALCNSAKKVIEYKGKARKASGIYYGLRAGTYYFKVTAKGGYSIVAKYAVKPNNGSRYMKTAKTLTRGKAMAGIMSGSEKYTVPDWYKIKITEWKDVTVYYDFRGHGRFKITIRNLDGSFKTGIDFFNVATRVQDGFYTITRYGIKPDTYYIGVSRGGQGTSGSYFLRWTYK